MLSADQRLAAARERLDREGWSLVVITRGGLEHVSRERGVVPLLDIVEKAGEGLRDAVLADKVVGRAAAMLVAVAGFSRVYARVLSMPSLAMSMHPSAFTPNWFQENVVLIL